MNKGLLKKGFYFDNNYIPFTAITSIFASGKCVVVRTTEREYSRVCASDAKANEETLRIVEKYEGHSLSDEDEMLNE